MRNQLAACYRKFKTATSSLQSPFLLLVRLYWGWQFMQTGWGKLHNISGVTNYFTQLGLPFPHLTVIFIALLEFGGGILMILGLASRLIAVPFIINMLVAYIVADREAFVSVFSDPGKFYGADPYTFLFASLLILVFGPGRFALDALIAKYWKDRERNAEDRKLPNARRGTKSGGG